jgi:hypothetical protein
LNESFHRKIQRVAMVLFYYSQRFYTPWVDNYKLHESSYDCFQACISE